MNKEAQEYFDILMAKDPESLTEDELGFLKARRGYIPEDKLSDYDFTEKPIETEAVAESVVEAPVEEKPVGSAVEDPVEPIAEAEAPVEPAVEEPEAPVEEKKN